MQILQLTSLVALIVCATCQIMPVKQYATKHAGAEVIDFPGPTLAYASNLQWDPTTTEQYPRLFFTADKGSPNLYVAQFDPTASGKDHSFWATGKSPFSFGAASAYFSIGVQGNTVIGPAYPTNFTQNNLPGFLIQTSYVPAEGNSNSDNTPGVPGYSFLSAVIDPTVRAGNIQYVYLTAWGPDDLVVIRGTFVAGPDAVVSFAPQTDVRTVDSQEKCFDQFTPYQSPALSLTATSLILSVPGRCAAFFKFTLTDANWNTATVVAHDPTDTNEKYVSSSTFDKKTSALYYTVKQYNTPGVTLFVFDTVHWVHFNTSLDADIAEGEALLAVGTGGNVTYLHVTASGANVIKRYTVDTTTQKFTAAGSASLDAYFNQVSSTLYISPYLYMTTYEPNAKLVRIISESFCTSFCGANAYCQDSKCQCNEGFTPDVTLPNLPCAPLKQVQLEVQGRQSEGAVAALGVLFAFSLLAAIAGWFLWWKGKRGYSSVQ